MKTKLLFSSLILVLFTSLSFGQLMTFGFIKNCMTYGRTTVTDELTKKQYFVVERSAKNTSNPLMEGSFQYSNEKERDAGKGEISVLSQINEKKLVTEISFVNGSKNDYSKNYNDLVKQMTSFFNNEKPVKSTKIKGDILKFTKDKIYYYVFTDNNKVPKIVISNYNIDELYF